MMRSAYKLAPLLAWLLMGAGILNAQIANGKSAASEDPVLRAMLAELQRSKTQLKLEDTQSPYYVDYRLMDVDQFVAEAAFGALRTSMRTRIRMLRIVVRVGDYKHDSYFGPGQGVVDVGPLDDDEASLRHQLWLGTDRAYKAAAEAFTAKQAELKKYTVDQPVDDFAHASPVQFTGPLVHLDLAPQPWLTTLEEASALYKTDPAVQSLNASLRFIATNRYFVSSEGTVVRSGDSFYQVYVGGYTQAADGMRLDRSHGYQVRLPNELPTKEEVLSRTRQLLTTLKQLREAPVSEEEYRGPVLFSADAASGIMSELVGPETGLTTTRAGCCPTSSPSWTIRRSQLMRGTVCWAVTWWMTKASNPAGFW